MKIKTKLTLGVGLLFIMIILLSLIGFRYINALKNDTENILVANYNTLEYSRNMILALDDLHQNPAAFKKFEDNLQKQQANVTEIGEKEATELLTEHFFKVNREPKDSNFQSLIRKDISEIMRLNMQAIQRKSDVAKQTASNANLWIALTGTICFLIAFTLLINLPNNIANPIKELTASIQQIASRNYHQRVHFESHNEYGDLATSFNTMAQKLEEYNNSNLSRLLVEKKRIETLISSMHDPVIGLDENRKVLFANDEALKITNLKPELLIGKKIQDVAVNNDLVRSLIQSAPTENGEASSNKTIKIFADNKESFFEKETVNITITPTGEKEQRHIGSVIILKNITPFKELDFAKTNFIATVSHELKTPIASIKMSLQLLQNAQTGNINDEQKELIESIKDDSNRLLKITSELLNMSQVETGNIQLSIQQSSPYEILQYAKEAVKMQAEQKHIELLVTAPDGLPNVKADSEKTVWVLVNFLTNAIRYSPERTKINIMVENLSDKQLLFSVKDQGRGIDIRYRDKIFDRYFQIPGSVKTGTGLGLAISKEFIEAQGGSVGVQSEIGMGSSFYFKMPVYS